MSIEYTIDIQLTELGFPDILQPEESSARETVSHSPTSLSNTHKRRLLSLDGEEAGPAKQTSHGQQSKLHCKGATPSESEPEAQAAQETKEVVLNDNTDTERRRATDEAQLMSEEGDGGQEGACHGDTAQDSSAEEQNDVEEDSDDSEVSDVYEEEEVDEEEVDEDEDGLNTELSPSVNHCCSVCDLQLPSKFKLQDHMNLHTGARPYCCAECGKRFCQIYNYRVHLRTHAQTKVDRLQCRICLRGFASQEDLGDHLSKTHFEDEFYECDLCKRVFTCLKTCESHVQLHKCKLDVVCDVCGRKFTSPKSLARHRKRKCHPNFKCTDCAKIFPKKNALLKHSFSHLGLLPYTCVRCHCHFRLAKLYRQHKCEPERLHCVACLREFPSQEDFKQHKKDTGCWGNQGPKGAEIRCLECGERFDNPEELKKHAGAHQRVLKCAECGKGFRSALLLMSHMGGHAGISPCLCQSCGLGFPHQQNYDSHLKTCGQGPQPVSASKKHQASKSSSSVTKKLSAKPNASAASNKVTMKAVVSNTPATHVKEPGDPSAGSGPSDGLWKLTLDKEPPPGMKLVLFLPVCSNQASGQPLSSPISGRPEVNEAHGGQLNSPLDLQTGMKREPEGATPLDLSKQCNSSKSALSDVPLVPFKNEPEEFKVSGEANGTEIQECKRRVRQLIVETKSGETDANAEMNKSKMDPIDLSSVSTSSELLVDVKRESHGSDPDLPSKFCQLTDCRLKTEIKKEK